MTSEKTEQPLEIQLDQLAADHGIPAVVYAMGMVLQVTAECLSAERADHAQWKTDRLDAIGERLKSIAAQIDNLGLCD
jgi:hypothetical protein